MKKNHLMGFETEFIILDDEGNVSTKADEIISEYSKTRFTFPIHKEYVHNMIEISSTANTKITKGAKNWLKTIKKITQIANKKNLRLYPFAVYPGNYIPTPRVDKYYRMCEDVLGPKKYTYCTGKSAGFHLHYTLPYGTFTKEKNLKQLFKSKYKDRLLNIYNALIAIDPATTNFMESSPYIDGKFIAKDSRLFIYRDMKIRSGKRIIKGLYSEMPLFGRLSKYYLTISDMISNVEKRYSSWKKIVEKKYPEYREIVESRHPLQFNWSPLRINRVGTFEYRGMDINLPTNMIGTSLLIKYFLNKVRKEELVIKPSDIGIKNPFKIEGNVMYVPPHTHLIENLQYKSAQFGFEDNEIFKYTKTFANIALKECPIKKDPSIDAIKNMLRTRKTKSDQIIEKVISKTGKGNTITDEVAKEIAIDYADEFEREIDFLMEKELAIDLEE